MKEAISSIRVSREEQADSGFGLEAQRQFAEVFEDRRPSWQCAPISVLTF
jgi:hypothetical protein